MFASANSQTWAYQSFIEWIERGEGPVNEMIERVKKGHAMMDQAGSNTEATRMKKHQKWSAATAPSSSSRSINMTGRIVRMNSAAA